MTSRKNWWDSNKPRGQLIRRFHCLPFGGNKCITYTRYQEQETINTAAYENTAIFPSFLPIQKIVFYFLKTKSPCLIFKRVRVCTPMYPLANQTCTLGAPLYHSLAYSLAAGSLPEPGCLSSGILSLCQPQCQGTVKTTNSPLYVGAGGLNSGPQTHTASTLTHWALSPELLKKIHILNVAELPLR